MTIFAAAMRYREEGVPLLVIAGKEYGTGSSRDWAAKGTHLLGAVAVLACSFERIHRSNLVGMGVLPLQFKPGDDPDSLGLTGSESYSLDEFNFRAETVSLRVQAADGGAARTLKVDVRIDTPKEWEYYRHRGILPYTIRSLASAAD